MPRPVTVLDVGGTALYWQTMPPEYRKDFCITLLNLEATEIEDPNISSVVGDARDMHCFEDQSFDVVFSNSVIEHVGTTSDQKRMADEIMRVGRSYCVQTPNKWFPIEPHFEFPLFQFLPVFVRARLMQRYSLGWYGRIPDAELARQHVLSIRLLSYRQFANLFPGATIYRERIFGLTKSFIAYTRPK